MKSKFPSLEWLQSFHEKLNSDKQYRRIAAKWEGDICVVVEPDDNFEDRLLYYWDLWHGQCNRVAILDSIDDEDPAFIITSSYGNFTQVLQGKLDPMQAMLTRKLKVKGNMAVMMRSVPVVLDFVRCAREITDEIM
ncbi:SCP2 sterol-binding domain-containing protein [Chloroflexota bacterium]